MAKRDWIIDRNDYDTEEDFRAAVADELARAEHSGYRLGFGVVAAPIRQRIDQGIVTLGWEFKSVTVPLVGGPPVQAGPIPHAPEPEPDAPIDEEPEAADEMPGVEELDDRTRELLDGEPEIEPDEPAVVSADKYAA